MQLFGMVFGFVAVDVLYFAVRFLGDPIWIEKSKSEPEVYELSFILNFILNISLKI